MGGTVASLNVGQPQTIVWRGETFTTAIVKTPARGPLLLAGVNFAGDDQANRIVHGGPARAAYAYAREDYAWWEAELGVALEAGRFGENLTLAGVDLCGAVAGERWCIGTAQVEVTLPRVPCMKLAMRMDDPQFVGRFSRSLRTGAMLAVIEAGEVRAGDAVELVSRPERSMRLDEMARIRLLETGRRAELLDIPNLPERWRAWASGER